MRDARTGKSKRAGVSGEPGPPEPVDWGLFYRAARKMGVSASEFWDMTLPEFFAEIDASQESRNGGRMTPAEIDDLSEWAFGDGGS